MAKDEDYNTKESLYQVDEVQQKLTDKFSVRTLDYRPDNKMVDEADYTDYTLNLHYTSHEKIDLEQTPAILNQMNQARLYKNELFRFMMRVTVNHMHKGEVYHTQVYTLRTPEDVEREKEKEEEALYWNANKM